MSLSRRRNACCATHASRKPWPSRCSLLSASVRQQAYRWQWTASAVGTDHCHSAQLGHRQAHVHDCRFCVVGWVKPHWLCEGSLLRLFTPSNDPGSEALSAMDSLIETCLSGCFSTSCVKQLSFVPLKVSSLRFWKSPLCVHILSRKGVEV